MGEIDLTNPLTFFFIFLIIVVLAMVVVNQVANSAKEIEINFTTSSYNQTILADNNSAQTLTHEPSTWTSATAKNRTWLSFDGVNDEVELITLDTSFISQTNNMTVSLWINMTALNTPQSIINLEESASEEFRIYWNNSDNELINTIHISNDVPVRNRKTFTNISLIDGKWFHLLITKNNSGSIDGIYINTTNFLNDTELGVALGAESNNKIGRSTAGLNGYADEIRIYNRTLTSIEISEIYNSGRFPNSSLPSTGLVLWLPFNENSGTDVHSFNQSDFT